MINKQIDNVICCFCGKQLDYKDSVQIVLSLMSIPDEIQTVYGHRVCLDINLDKSIPRHPDLIENE